MSSTRDPKPFCVGRTPPLYGPLLSQHPILQCKQQIDLFNQYKAGSIKARDSLILQCIAPVLSLAKRYSKSDEYDDIVQLGIIGATHALTKFNPAKNIPFTAYAYMWASAYMSRHTKNGMKVVKHGTSGFNSVSCEPLDHHMSLPSKADVEDEVSLKLMRDTAHELISQLPPLQKNVMESRLAGMTQTEVADTLCVSRQVIQHREKAALKNIAEAIKPRSRTYAA
jgi:RNA polymerase sigma factor (sigma-70 family)